MVAEKVHELAMASHDTQAHLEELYTRMRADVNAQWNRDLPFEELLFDRWERAKHLGFGEKSSIYHNAYVYGDVTVGDNTWIGPYTVLDGTAGLTIGRFCSISAGVHIYTHDSVAWALTGGSQAYVNEPVSIGDCSYIGSQTVIAKGVTIGKHVVIGANSFVNRDIPDYSIAASSPCRVIGHVEIEDGTARLVYDETKE